MGIGNVGGTGRLGITRNTGVGWLRQISTRTFIPNSFYGANKQIMSRTFHYARDTISSLKIVLPNFYVPIAAAPNMTEAGTGANATVTASIEYPAGTFTQVKFSGAVSGSIQNNSMLFSDDVHVDIPDGAKFFVRTWYSNANGIIYNLYATSAASAGDGVEYGVTTTDKTMSGTVSQATQILGVAPCAVIAKTRKNAVYLLGDSRAAGLNDVGDTSGDVGELARSIGQTVAYMNCGVSGDRAIDFTTGSQSANRRALMAYCTHMIVQLGINDLSRGSSVASILSAYQTIAGYFSGAKYSCTIAPLTTSSDNWATVANQTAFAQEANRVTLNATHRANLSSFAGYFELADQVESARDSGKWKCDGTALKWTSDGIHENQFANLAIQSSGAISSALFA